MRRFISSSESFCWRCRGILKMSLDMEVLSASFALSHQFAGTSIGRHHFCAPYILLIPLGLPRPHTTSVYPPPPSPHHSPTSAAFLLSLFTITIFLVISTSNMKLKTTTLRSRVTLPTEAAKCPVAQLHFSWHADLYHHRLSQNTMKVVGLPQP